MDTFKMNTEKKKTDETDAPNTAVLADLPVAQPNEESITGGLLDNSHGTHVTGTIGAVGTELTSRRTGQ